MSLKIVLVESLGTVSYSTSIVTMLYHFRDNILFSLVKLV